VDNLTDTVMHLRDKVPDEGRVYAGEKVRGHTIDMYSGGTGQETKSRVMRDFCRVDSVTKILVCTIAFGMGVNIKNLYNCFILDIPDDPSLLMQEVGRVSRDGNDGIVTLVVPKTSNRDIIKCVTSGCIRKNLLSLFLPSTEQVEESDRKRCTKCFCCSFCKQTCSEHTMEVAH